MYAQLIADIADYVLFCSCMLILLSSIYLTYKLRFVQLGVFKTIFNLFRSRGTNISSETNHTILPHKALFTAMSTTLGISTIVAPVIAISLGGPGALVGFLLTAFLGSAATYLEVSLSVRHRKKLDSGQIMGGPMQYLKQIFSPALAKWYAVCCLILMTAWSGAQANQIAAILDSPLLGEWRIAPSVSAGLIAAFVLLLLFGGIKRIGSFSTYVVPIMFVLYIGSSFWILLANFDQLGAVFSEIIQSLFIPKQLATGAFVGGVVTALRWGVFKGIQACEAGLGTQAIPHAMAETKDPEAQGMIAMISTYTSGLLAFLSGCIALLTKTWQDPSLPLGISMVAKSFEIYFSSFGVIIIAITTFLFAFGTILGNCYNGSQCFGFLTNNKKIPIYLIGSVCMMFVGALSDVKTFWSCIDIILACAILPHMAALVWSVRQSSKAAIPLAEKV
jgi:AGCS family alanine or glycine:cation symporter